MNTPQEIASAKLLKEMRGWHAIELTSHANSYDRSIVGSGTKGSNSSEYDFHYIETSTHQRYGDFVLKDYQGAAHIEAFCDGKRNINFHYAVSKPKLLTEVRIERHFMGEGSSLWVDIPIPYYYFYAGMIPLYQAISKATLRGTSKILGRECDVFHVKQVPMAKGEPLEVVFHLDHETAIPLRVEMFLDAEALAANRSHHRWEAASFDIVQGYHIPLKSGLVHQAYSGPSSTGKMVSELTTKVEVKEIHFDRSYPSATFVTQLPTSVPIFDSFTGKIRPPSTVDVDSLRTATSDGPEVADGLTITSQVSIGFGILVLVACSLIAIRRFIKTHRRNNVKTH
jgi:hypothetical protein